MFLFTTAGAASESEYQDEETTADFDGQSIRLFLKRKKGGRGYGL